MTYFADLSPYEFFKGKNRDGKLLNVGWLDLSHSFPTEEAGAELVAKLGQLCRKRVMQTRGYHRCPFCPREKTGWSAQIDEEIIHLGSAEIRVPGKAGTVYACPDLIYHYVRDHHYRPPNEFLVAVLASDH